MRFKKKFFYTFQCSVTCGVGQQYRSLECVWKYSSHESAGEACNSRRSTPKKVKQCKEVPCVTTTTSTPNPPMLKGIKLFN